MSTIPLLPSTGMDNVHADGHAVFQPRPSKNGMEPPERMRAVVDLDIDTDGVLTTRAGVTPMYIVPGPAQGAWTCGNRAFFQILGELYEVGRELPYAAGQALPWISGLADPVKLCEHWGVIYGTDGAKYFKFGPDGVLTNWGLPVPTVTARVTTPGELEEGGYLVQASFTDSDGNEGGASPIVRVSAPRLNALLVDVSGFTSAVSSVNIYASHANQSYPTFVAQVGPADLPYYVTKITTDADQAPATECIGPPIGAEGLVSFRAFLMVWRGHVMFRSEGAEPDLFHPDNIMQFPAKIRAAEAVPGGLWVGTAGGLWFVTGDDPASWIPRQVTRDPVAAGSMTIEGSKLGGLQTAGRVALFVARNGLIAGLSDGTAVPLTQDRYHFSATSKVDLAYREHGGVRQILVLVEPVS